MRGLKSVGWICGWMLCGSWLAVAQSTQPLERFDDVRLLPADGNDGDSFLIELEREGKSQQHMLRLYYVDAPESTAGSDTDRRRLLEQARYFGVKDPQTVMKFGEKATERVAELLAEPFIVYTAFATAPGRSRLPRIYGMVTLSTGEDLALVLLREGLARNQGVGREMYDGISAADYKEFLADYEQSAAMTRQGIWAESNPELLPEARQSQRQETLELRRAFASLQASPENPVKINEADISELQALPGIGPQLAQAIIDNRPYASAEDLTRVRGIGPALSGRLRDLVDVSD